MKNCAPSFRFTTPTWNPRRVTCRPTCKSVSCGLPAVPAAVAEMRGKNYLSLGGVSMGIIGADVRRNIMLDYLGMGTVAVDMVAIKGRIDQGFYDHAELDLAFKFMKKNFPPEADPPPAESLCSVTAQGPIHPTNF